MDGPLAASQCPLLTAVAVAILGALVAALGFAAVAVVIFLIFGFLYPSLFVPVCMAGPIASSHDRRGHPRSAKLARALRASIDLKLPFVATYLFEDDNHAYYRVRQQKAVLRLAVPRRGDGRLVRLLQLPWPPSGPLLGGYL